MIEFSCPICVACNNVTYPRSRSGGSGNTNWDCFGRRLPRYGRHPGHLHRKDEEEEEEEALFDSSVIRGD